MPSPANVDGIDLVPPAPGRLLAPRVFTSPALFELEHRAVFARSWVHVADRIDLPEPGSYVAAAIGRTPVLIIRDRQTGELRGFLNACRHRGAKLVDGKGHCDKQIKCPYHAWSYGSDGALLGVPYRDEMTCDVSAMGLIPIRVGTVGPLVFASLDPDAPPLDAWVGQLPAAFAAAGVDGWKLGWELQYDIAANWKLFVENANDGYHIQFVHDILTDLLKPDSGETTLEAHGAYTLAEINPAYIPPVEGPTPLATEPRIRFGHVFPNFVPVLSPLDLTYLRVDPVAVDRLRLFVRSYDHPDMPPPLRDFRKAAFERTTMQDIAVVERTHAGALADGPGGVFHPRLEDRIGHFEHLWVDAMAREAAPGSSSRRPAMLAVAP
jgi:Rieske 2Fe-2S family protein